MRKENRNTVQILLEEHRKELDRAKNFTDWVTEWLPEQRANVTRTIHQEEQIIDRLQKILERGEKGC